MDWIPLIKDKQSVDEIEKLIHEIAERVIANTKKGDYAGNLWLFLTFYY